MIIVRLTKTFMTAALAVFAGIVAYDNIVDYGSNYAFVQHVLSMDTVFPGNALIGRAITDPQMWKLGYAAIIAGEALTAVLLALAALDMVFSLRNGPRFAKAKGLVAAGVGLGFAIFFFGFTVVGGEYFDMWQSKDWNGQQSAFRIYMTMLAVLIYVSLPEPEPGSSEA
jgi:predicted small integral membrane protein